MLDSLHLFFINVLVEFSSLKWQTETLGLLLVSIIVTVLSLSLSLLSIAVSVGNPLS